MTARSNTAEGAPGAVALVQGSGGNTGGLSGDFANTVSSGTGTTQAFDNSRSMHGTWSYTFATGGTSASASFNWTGIAGMALCTGRCYVNASAFVGIGSLVRLRGATVQTARIAISATGQVQIRDTGNGLITSTTNILTANSWARIEWSINVGASATGDVWLYLTPDAPIGSHTETLHVTAQNFGTNNVDEAGFGFPSAATNGSQIWMDDFWVSDAVDRPGPTQLWTPRPAVFIMPMPLYRLPGLVLVAAPQAAVVQPSVTTPAPLVVTPPALVPPQLPQPVLLRSSLADVVVPAPTPSPMVVSQPAAWISPARPVLVRSSIQDFATPATRGPIVVTQQTVTARPQPAMLVRSSIQDFATPVGTRPLVATTQTSPVRPAATILIRSTLTDPVTPAAACAQPLIVTMQYRPPASPPAILIRSPAAASCTVIRPDTGDVVRPDSGTVTRPTTGLVTRPGVGTVTRPNTGLVVRPGCH